MRAKMSDRSGLSSLRPEMYPADLGFLTRESEREARAILAETEGPGQHETLATLLAPDCYSAEKRSSLAESLRAFVEA